MIFGLIRRWSLQVTGQWGELLVLLDIWELKVRWLKSIVQFSAPLLAKRHDLESAAVLLGKSFVPDGLDSRAGTWNHQIVRNIKRS